MKWIFGRPRLPGEYLLALKNMMYGHTFFKHIVIEADGRYFEPDREQLCYLGPHIEKVAYLMLVFPKQQDSRGKELSREMP